MVLKCLYFSINLDVTLLYYFVYSIKTADFPYLCLAYKIPSGVAVAAVFYIQDLGWRSIAMTTADSDGYMYELLGNWNDGGGADDIIDDDT